MQNLNFTDVYITSRVSVIFRISSYLIGQEAIRRAPAQLKRRSKLCNFIKFKRGIITILQKRVVEVKYVCQ